jgi:hypothetical protein
VELKKGSEVIDSAELNEKNHWTHSWSGLAKFDNGEKIIYTVTEAQVPGYSAPVIKRVSETEFEYTVTNSRDYEETEVKVLKVWDDNDNAEGFRPASVKVNLKKGSTTIESVTLDESNNWTYTWEKLQKYEGGKAIEYTVTEDPVTNYSTKITKAADGTLHLYSEEQPDHRKD